METLIVDPVTLTALVEKGHLVALTARANRLVLSPTTVEVLVASGVIEALVKEEIEPLVDVVSLTQQDEALAQRLLSALTTLHPAADPLTARALAEGLALMRRSDLAAACFLCDDPTIQPLAQSHALTVCSSLDFLDSVPPATPKPPPAPLHLLPLTPDEETRALLTALVARGIGADEGEVLRRAVRALAVGVGLREG